MVYTYTSQLLQKYVRTPPYSYLPAFSLGSRRPNDGPHLPEHFPNRSVLHGNR